MAFLYPGSPGDTVVPLPLMLSLWPWHSPIGNPWMAPHDPRSSLAWHSRLCTILLPLCLAALLFSHHKLLTFHSCLLFSFPCALLVPFQQLETPTLPAAASDSPLMHLLQGAFPAAAHWTEPLPSPNTEHPQLPPHNTNPVTTYSFALFILTLPEIVQDLAHNFGTPKFKKKKRRKRRYVNG